MLEKYATTKQDRKKGIKRTPAEDGKKITYTMYKDMIET